MAQPIRTAAAKKYLNELDDTGMAGITIQEEGIAVNAAGANAILNFVGAAVTATSAAADTATITIPAGTLTVASDAGTDSAPTNITSVNLAQLQRLTVTMPGVATTVYIYEMVVEFDVTDRGVASNFTIDWTGGFIDDETDIVRIGTSAASGNNIAPASIQFPVSPNTCTVYCNAFAGAGLLEGVRINFSWWSSA